MLQWSKNFQAITNHIILLKSIFLQNNNVNSGRKWMSKIDPTISYLHALKKWDIFPSTINWFNKDFSDVLICISAPELRRKSSILIPNPLFPNYQILQQWDPSLHLSIFHILDIKIQSSRSQLAPKEHILPVVMILD